jgi:hypothetical protein
VIVADDSARASGTGPASRRETLQGGGIAARWIGVGSS